MKIEIYPVTYESYESEEIAENSIDNVAIYDGILSAWEYSDNSNPELLVVECDQEIGILLNHQISGLGDYERTADNTFKYIISTSDVFESIGKHGIYDQTADNDDFIEFSNARIIKIGEEFQYEKI